MSEQAERLLREYREKTQASPETGTAAWRALSDRLDASGSRISDAARNTLVGAIAVFLGVCLLGSAYPRSWSASGNASRTSPTGAGGSEGSSGTPGAGGIGWSIAGDDA
jgi:hypothetical protein